MACHKLLHLGHDGDRDDDCDHGLDDDCDHGLDDDCDHGHDRGNEDEVDDNHGNYDARV